MHAGAGVSGLTMSARKQQLLNRHRKRKRLVVLVLLCVLLLSGLWLWWLPPVFALLLWVGHEAWFSDHLFYVAASDYEYDMQGCGRYPLHSRDGSLTLPSDCVLDASQTLLLRVQLRASLLGRLLDPAVVIEGGNADKQLRARRQGRALPQSQWSGRCIGSWATAFARAPLPAGS